MSTPRAGYMIRDEFAPHFITFSVIDWIDIFTRSIYSGIVLQTLNYCRDNFGLRIHAYVIMTNHVHAILSHPNGELRKTITSFKKHTGLEIIRTIQHPRESRRLWMLYRFAYAAKTARGKADHQFWEHGNHPIGIYSALRLHRVMRYIHYNPVKAGYVDDPVDWRYSSARDYAGKEGLIKVDLLKW